MLVFVEEGKPENREKNPRSKARTNNKLIPHETVSTGIEPVTEVGLRRALIHCANRARYSLSDKKSFSHVTVCEID